jgi:hypothetical protein
MASPASKAPGDKGLSDTQSGRISGYEIDCGRISMMYGLF